MNYKKRTEENECEFNRVIKVYDPEFKIERNRQVDCPKTNRNCLKCGWNPSVEKRRIQSYEARYRDYERAKALLKGKNLPAEKYEAELQRIAKELKI